MRARTMAGVAALLVLLAGTACSGGGGAPSGALGVSGSGGGGGGGGAGGGADPAFYTTPAVVGTGLRTVNVAAGAGQTLQQAFDAALPGDTIVVGAGTHALGGGNLTLRRSGTAMSWIVVRGAPGGPRPAIDLGAGGELTVAASFVLIEALEIRNGGGNNLHIAPQSASIESIIIRNCRIHSLASGPGAAIKINRNNPAGAGVELVYVEGCDLSESIANAVVDGVGVSRAVVRGNDIHDNAPGSHGIFFKGGSSEVLIEGNLIRGIRGNAALQLGGNTGAAFFDPAFPDQEGVDQVARNNLIADCDDSIFEVRGVRRGRIHHNTAVTATGFAIFRLSLGSSASGGASGNDDIDFANNLMISRSGTPQFARNDGNAGALRFGRALWAGDFRNSSTPGPGIPTFPVPFDVSVAATALGAVVVDPTFAGVTGLPDALARWRLAASSPARGAGEASSLVPRDIQGAPRSASAPSVGAFE